MSRNITVTIDPFNPRSIEKAQKIIKQETTFFDRTVDECLKEIAEIGRETAQLQYGEDADVQLAYDDERHEYEIIAVARDGQSMAVLEFGAGGTVASGNLYADKMPFEVSSGSWSRINEETFGSPPGPYARYGYWVHNGTKYTELQPRNGMQAVYSEIMRNYRTVFRSRFKGNFNIDLTGR